MRIRGSLIGLASLFLAARIASTQWTRSSCPFSLAGDEAAPTVVGPEEILERILLLDQPDSPLVIVYADFSDGIVIDDGERISFEDGYTLTVANRSDRPVLGFIARASLRTTRGGAGGGGGAGWKGVLSPGDRVEIGEPPGQGHAEVGAAGGGFRLVLWIESVRFADCEYHPSKGFIDLDRAIDSR